MEWVRDTLPWPSAQQDQSKLYHLPPPTIGPQSTVSPPEERTAKDTTPSSLDSDPLVWRGWEELVTEQGGASLSQLIVGVKRLIWGCRNTSCSGRSSGCRVVTLAGGLHTRTHGDMPVKGHLALREASCSHAEPHTGTRAPTCPDVSPGEAAGSTGDAT